MSWSSSAPSGVSFPSSTKVSDERRWNYYSAYPMNVWVSRGTGNTYYVKVTVNWSDKQNFAMPSSMNTQTKYYTGSRGASGTVTVGVSPNSNLSVACEVTSANIAAATYIISYNANGGSGGPSEQAKTYNVNLTLSSSTPTRTGYTFTGWNTAANGSGTSYAAGGTYTANSSVTLYAQWVKSAVPIYVNDNGTIHQLEKVYANVGGTIKECKVYTNVGGTIKTLE